MSLPVVLIPEARDEFDEAFDWYERQKKGLGITFSDHVQRVYDRISATPEMDRVVRQDVRKAGVKRFPYSNYYRVEPTRIVVLAEFHGRRDPRVWQARI
jgi:plasmid stabilization system protein ParE